MEGACGHRVYGSAEFAALKKKTEFKPGDAQEGFKRILIDDVGSRPSSELMEDLTVRSRLCMRQKKNNIILRRIIAVLHVKADISIYFCMR